MKRDRERKSTKMQDLSDFLEVIPKKENISYENPVKIVGKRQQSGWDIKFPKEHREKPVEEWNKQDTVRYFYLCYRDKYGCSLMGNIPWQLNYIKLADTRAALAAQLNLQDECPLSLVKDYFDFFYERHADEIINTKQAHWHLQFDDVAKLKYIRSFVMARGHSYSIKQETPQPAAAEPVLETNTLTLLSIQTAHKIHSQHFVTTYGTVIPVNYLMIVKKYPAEKALNYLKKAMSKVSSDVAKAATDKWGPYPSWLPHTDNSKIGGEPISIGETDRFDFFKESIVANG